MGFIDYHGQREDHYDDVVAFAEENEKLQKENFGEQIKKNKYSEFFCVPELKKLSREDIIKVLVNEHIQLTEKYNNLIMNNGITASDKIFNYHADLYTFLIANYLSQADISNDKKEKVCKVLFNKAFKLNSDIDISSLFKSLDNNYYKNNYILKSGGKTKFWQWIGFLSDKSKLGVDYADLYLQFDAHLAYYLNLLIPDSGIGHDYPVIRRVNEHVIMNSLSHKAKYPKILENMDNPLRAHDTENTVSQSRPVESTDVEEDSEIDNSILEDDTFVIRYNLDKAKIERLLEKSDMSSYIDCTRILISCDLPEDIDVEFVNLKNRLVVLNNSLEKFPAEKEPSERFIEYYIPEIIDLTATYIDYMNTGIEDSIINGAKYDIIRSVKALINAINDRLEEIFLYTSMEIKARAAAMESIMGQDGFVNPDYKISSTS